MAQDPVSYFAPELAGPTGIACNACYLDFENQPWTAPDGYRFYQRFTGWYRLFPWEPWSYERFGLILQSTSEPGTFMIAFRGTYSMIDAIYDMDWELRQFPIAGSQARVAGGFLDIYTKHQAAQPSMRVQLMDFLRSTRINILTVTGHSLGGALSSLFTFDAAMSYAGQQGIAAPTMIAATYASPRVGDARWKQEYNTVMMQPPTTPLTVRAHNVEDVVTYAPPNDLGYEHVGLDFAVDFYESEISIYALLVRHSLLNYNYVLGKALVNVPQRWAGVFPDQSRSVPTATSVYPTTIAPEHMERVRRARELVSVRGGAAPAQGVDPDIQVKPVGQPTCTPD